MQTNAKWVTFLPRFQWNHPIPTKRRSFSHPVSIFSTYDQIFSSIFMYKGLPCRVWWSIFYSKFVDCILCKIVVQHICFVKVAGKETWKYLLFFKNLPDFRSLHLKSTVICQAALFEYGEPWNVKWHVLVKYVQMVNYTTYLFTCKQVLVLSVSLCRWHCREF